MHFGKTPHLARPEKSKIFFLKSALQNCVVRKALPESGSIFPKIDQNRPKFPGISGKISPGNFSPEKFPEIFPKFSSEISRNFMNFNIFKRQIQGCNIRFNPKNAEKFGENFPTFFGENFPEFPGNFLPKFPEISSIFNF